MKKLLAILALSGGALFALASPASAAGQVCYDVHIAIAGQAPISQAGCQALP